MNAHRNHNILELLSRRETYGVRQSQERIASTGMKRKDHVRCRDLAIACPWSRKRLQNMILCVGPGTPASVLMRYETGSASSSDENNYSESGESGESSVHSLGSVEDGGGNLEEILSLSGRKRNLNRKSQNEQEESDCEHQATTVGAEDHSEGKDDENDISSASDTNNYPWQQSSNCRASMTHGGCINTASWLDCPWKLSAARTDDVSSILNCLIMSSSYSSNSIEVGGGVDLGSSSPRAVPCTECPTQIITSGDDKMVKVWDISSSIGTFSPVPGPTTTCPFAYSRRKPDFSSLVKSWKKTYRTTTRIPGIVNLLATVRTGHRANVFHATPLFSKPGSILTCGADGLLNMCNIETETISSIISVEGPRSSMCFSHHMLDQNTGLLCSEKGLIRFDLRIPRTSQSSVPLLGEEMCKSCAVYSAPESETSGYVFAGGESEVGLYDLRFLGDPTKVIQTYRPSCFPSGVDVSVSGIDVSKDRKELLVSYENDQIYTFPIFPTFASDPTVDEMISFSEEHEQQSETKIVDNSHFASYGGHMNRFTFLKCAKYAGPNDEYICTGSDSGHSFIYDKFSGSVVSLLKADMSTCNGIIPHPTLPVFVTYGISSTAKLWRATIPVDDGDDDSVNGRRKAYHNENFAKSALVSKWKDVQANLSRMCTDQTLQDRNARLFPGEYPLQSINANGHVFEGLPVFFRSLFHENPVNPGSKYIINDLKSLPEVIKYNYYEAVCSLIEGDDEPVRCGINELHRRISLIRLCHQAQQLGLKMLDYDTPWKFEPIGIPNISNADLMKLSLIALIPECPGDWIPYDKNFTAICSNGGRALNKGDYESFYNLRYRGDAVEEFEVEESSIHASEEGSPNTLEAWDCLYDTIKRLKEEGNDAFKGGCIHLAARHYDRALDYCAVAFMEYPQTTLDFVSSHQKMLSKNAGHCVRWSALLRTFISVRLNLSMVMLKPEISDPSGAQVQALLALKDLNPFCQAAGIVLTGRNLQRTRENEPDESFKEAKELQIKAYFRLGSAKLQSGEHNQAIHYLSKSLSVAKELHPAVRPDKAVIHKLSEAKRLREKEKKRRRKQLKIAFSGEEGSKPSSL